MSTSIELCHKSEVVDQNAALLNESEMTGTEPASVTSVSMVMPNTQLENVNISWHNISVTTKPKRICFRMKNSVPILKSVSGQVDSGQLLAIMGPSGSGKTTLLNVLNGRNLSSYNIEGSVLINGQPSRIDMIKSLSGYVQQGSIFVPMLTVKEYLVFQSLVRMDRKCYTTEQRSKRIDEVISELGLTKCSNSRIGNRYDDLVGSGISGGELRRLAFAAEILTNPPILICDEPTSGLDSYLAESVVKMLRKLTNSGRTVICTIHQPSSEVFILFDRLLLLTEGRFAFMGTLPEAQEHFNSLGMVCPNQFNPADHYLRQISIEPGNEIDSQERIDKICSNYSCSKKSMSNGNQTQIDVHKTDFVNNRMPAYKASWLQQFTALLWRSFISNSREPMITRIKLTQTITVALLMGIVYWKQQLDQKGIMNINGAIFILMINLTFMNIFSVINTFCSELSIFLREHNDGMYRVDTYFLSKQAAELPYQILMPSVFIMIQYHMIGFYNSWDTYLMFIFISNLVANCGISFGYMISCMSSTTKVAIAISSPMILPLLLFGGFFINNSSIPVYLRIFKHLSWFYYANEALIITQWENVESIQCPELTNSTTGVTTRMTTFNMEQRCLHHGLSVIDELSFNTENIFYDICCLVGLIIGMRLIAFFALLRRSERR
ncbi:ATPase [Blomia tropicalis]|nr:ATPase [Blomia tropicalis]